MAHFSTIDYGIFAFSLVVSLAVGVYQAWRARGVDPEAAMEQYVMGGRRMPVMPVTLSLLVTILSSIGVIGVPAEVYQIGAIFWLFYLMILGSIVICGLYFLPIFYKMKLVSIYEYFEVRFGSLALRRLVSGIFVLQTIVVAAIVLFAPAMALIGVTKQPLWPYIVALGVTATVYTTIGGLKAVVWTDTLQAGFIYTGIAILVIKGTMDAGGLSRVYDVALSSGRIHSLLRFDPNPAQHLSLWICAASGTIVWMGHFGLNQMAMQRYCALPSIRDAQKVMAISVPIFLISSTGMCYIGIVMLVYFYDCDPLATKEIESKDQLVILFATKVLGSTAIPGLPGLFLACVFSTSLSTLSSGYSSAAAVCYEDFMKQSLHEKISDRTAMLINKVLVVVFGLFSIALAFAVKDLGGIIKVAVAALAVLGGPTVGLFFVGLLLKWASKYAAFAGWISAVIVALTAFIGGIIHHPYNGYSLPMGNTCAQLANVTMLPRAYDPHYGNPAVPYVFRISIYLVGGLTTVVVLFVALVVSAVEALIKILVHKYARKVYRINVIEKDNGIVSNTFEMSNMRH